MVENIIETQVIIEEIIKIHYYIDFNLKCNTKNEIQSRNFTAITDAKLGHTNDPKLKM